MVLWCVVYGCSNKKDQNNFKDFISSLKTIRIFPQTCFSHIFSSCNCHYRECMSVDFLTFSLT